MSKQKQFEKAMAVYVKWREKNLVPAGWYEKRPYWELGDPTSWLCTENVGGVELYYQDLVSELNDISGVVAKFARAYDTSAGVEFAIEL